MNKKELQINLRVSKNEKEKITSYAKEYGYRNVSDYIVKSSLGKVDKSSGGLKINTLTLNPAIDYIIRTENKLDEITNFGPNDKEFIAGGKGINASIIIDEYGVNNLTLHYSGGFSGELIKKELITRNLQQTQIISSDDTRINLKLNFDKDNYEINSLATPLSSKARNILKNIISKFEENEVLMIMGSYHNNDEDFIIEISEITKQNNIQVVYDISKPLLKNLLKYKPIIIKPNKEELEWIFNTKINSENDIIKYMYKLQEQGAQNVAVTLGKDGAILLDSNKQLYKAIVDPIKLASPQGSGDSFISTFVVKLSSGFENAFKWANAAGAATAQVNGLANLDLIEKTLPKVHIERLDI